MHLGTLAVFFLVREGICGDPGFSYIFHSHMFVPELLILCGSTVSATPLVQSHCRRHDHHPPAQ